MLVPLPRRHRNPEDNVLPLINIVFLLLIFFMVAGVIRPREPFPLTPPETVNAAAAERENRVLAIGAEGELALAGEALDMAELRDRLAGPTAGERPLWIKADGQLPAGRFSDILVELRAAGVAEVRLLTTPAP